MPTYEYECRACGYSFERVQNMSDDPVRDCPECGKDVRRLIFGGSGVIFKGSGFYVNDSRGKNPAAPASTKSTSGDSGGDSSSSGAKKGEASSGGPSAGAKPAASASATAGSGGSAGSSGGKSSAAKDKA